MNECPCDIIHDHITDIIKFSTDKGDLSFTQQYVIKSVDKCTIKIRRSLDDKWELGSSLLQAYAITVDTKSEKKQYKFIPIEHVKAFIDQETKRVDGTPQPLACAHWAIAGIGWHRLPQDNKPYDIGEPLMNSCKFQSVRSSSASLRLSEADF
uniref:AlNc14C662G12357 protein n=1 Tax=Albugo laibachii Nc14 TaxID=890382 RepID=F0X1P3_9STRA|nr:AlNc14C662G12357 [Albugo laibachii Nc14]|eukprot:CCA27741.1 AlNc14C662G12357 [Albugo laibachii Nc14]